MKLFPLKQLFLLTLAFLSITIPSVRAQILNPYDCILLTSNDGYSEFISPYRNLGKDIQKQLNRFHHQNDHNEIKFKVERETINIERISFTHKNFTVDDIPLEKALQESLMRYHSQLEQGRCYTGHFYHPSLINLTGQAGKAIVLSKPVKYTAFILAFPITVPLSILDYVSVMSLQ